MDSFCDQPRDVPKPTNINKFITPTIVPDVSIIQTPSTRMNRKSQIESGESYNVWKARNFNKENSQQLANRFDAGSRKQVRFDPPLLRCQSDPSDRTSSAKECFNNDDSLNKNDVPPLERFKTQRNDKRTNAFNFEQIYMANIPNRNLDLSMIEPLKQTSGENFDKINSKASVVNNYDVYNYKSPRTDNYVSENSGTHLNSRDLHKKLIYDDNFELSKKEHCKHSSDRQIQQNQNSDNQTVKELLKVIQQQNEQIILLQKQVASLLEMNTKPEPPKEKINSDEFDCRKSRKGQYSKLAIDVMTSFEVSIRPPHNQNRGRSREAENQFGPFDSPKIKEIDPPMIKEASADRQIGNVLDGIKDTKKKDNDDVSISLNEPLKVIERCPSPEETIHVDMKDYSSDEEDSSGSSTDIGWTLYNNIMGQVNNIFRNADHTRDDDGKPAEGMKEQTMRKVQEATMKHLRSIGVNLPLIEENDDAGGTSNAEYTPTEVSFAVKQLLMKYLPNEQLAKLAYNETKKIKRGSDNLIRRRPEFSFATVQYMKKYNLLAADHEPKPQLNQHKILDVTALKRQPKLL